MLDIDYRQQQTTLHCTFSGSFRSDECSAVAATLEKRVAAVAAGGKLPEGFRIAFDLEKASYISSSFLRIVLITAKRVRRGYFQIEKASPFVRELLRSSGLDQLLGNTSGSIETVAHETRILPPPAEFAATSNLASLEEYHRLYAASLDTPEQFWSEQADKHLVWIERYSQVLDWNPPDARWFVGGKLNASSNALDRHLTGPRANKAAILWEGEPCGSDRPGEERVLTYRQLHREVCRFANVLKRHGVGKGDRVLLYLPMVPEVAIAMLACARIGAIHSVVFAGFSAQAVADRARDCGAKLIVTADAGYRRGTAVLLKRCVDEALELADDDGRTVGELVKKVIVLRRAGTEVKMVDGRDVFWHDEIERVTAHCPAEPMDSEDGLFILYTSGSTGKPKGILHTTAGYLLATKMTHQYVFDLKVADVFWCTADIGWITGHSYGVYGPLANGATVVMYEGAPNYPEKDRFWRIIEKYGVTVFYTAPTAIRAFIEWGDAWPKKHDLSSLRLLGTVGEPINPHVWTWFHEVIGASRCPIVDTWWQTETGAIMLTTLPGAMSTKPGCAGLPFFGVDPAIVDEQGQLLPSNAGGKLILRRPWPSMLRGVWGDRERFIWTYWKEVPGAYVTGDGARVDRDGYIWVVGRIDDVLNVSGHRIGTAEVESALGSHPAVAEAAVVGRPDDMKGFAIVAFVTPRADAKVTPELREELRAHVARELGAVARPDEIRFAEALPKTRSGKIMRRVLKQIAAGTEITGDMTTMEDFTVLTRLSDRSS
jgi:acetyl-CoA synthetase